MAKQRKGESSKRPGPAMHGSSPGPCEQPSMEEE